MKTSITLPESLYLEVRAVAAKTGKGIGEIIVYWASLGKEVDNAKPKRKGKFQPADLGKPKMSVYSRSELYDALDDEV